MSENDENQKNENVEVEFGESKNFVYYVTQFRGAIIGAVVSLIFIATGLSKLLVGLVILAAGAFLGNYIQKNKTHVKQSLKEFIDKF